MECSRKGSIKWIKTCTKKSIENPNVVLRGRGELGGLELLYLKGNFSATVPYRLALRSFRGSQLKTHSVCWKWYVSGEIVAEAVPSSLPGFVREDINLVNAVPVCLFYRFEGKPSCLSREALAGTRWYLCTSKNPLCSDETWPNLSDKVAIDKIHNWVWWIGWWAYICSFYFTDTCIQIWNRILKMWWTRRRWTRTRWTLGKTSAEEKKRLNLGIAWKGGGLDTVTDT